jgi:hypothetical protein
VQIANKMGSQKKFLPQVLYNVWCLSKSYAHKHYFKKQLVEKKIKEKEEEMQQHR